ncbi:OmpA family protein [Pseudopedobacter sp.]|uniref:OmpA family protein n=1 Tax=Pseudopedobacter sp. TaxID=1936787 RepID=UPI003342AC99
MKIQKLTAIFSFFVLNASAQFVPDYKRAADVYFQNQEYYAASEYYKKALNISNDSVGNLILPYTPESKTKASKKQNTEVEQMVFNLAESYRIYKDYQNAEKWYAIAKDFKEEKYALSPYWYAVSLRANNKYEEAIQAFGNFIKNYQGDQNVIAQAKREIESSKFALSEMKYPRLATLKQLQAPLNAKGSNYAPVIQNNLMYFTSSRPLNVSKKTEVLSSGSSKVKKKESPYINAIYSVERANISGDNININKVDLGLAATENAAIALTPDGGRAFFTKWDTKENTKSIYTAVKMGEKWSNPESAGIQINIKGYNSIQPFITPDGKYLIFSSDRPGGQGKYDLWFAPVRADGSLGQALNLGEEINTTGDEQAPYYNSRNKALLYSSNGRVGLGGYDFYESKGDFSTWSAPENLGFPFNSAKDDIYFTATDGNGHEGFISSDRESVCCLELFQVKREFINLKGTLLDCETGKPVEKAKISLTDSLNNTTKELSAGLNGEYTFALDAPRPIKITVEKEGYFTKTIRFSRQDLAKADTLLNPNLCLTPLVIDKPIVLKDIYYEFNSAELTPMSAQALDILADIMADNPKIAIELSSHTDAIGSDAYNLDLSQRRAQSCVDYLIAKGTSVDKIQAKGYGESMPIAPNTINGKDNPEGRALNRRTEFKVIKK